MASHSVNVNARYLNFLLSLRFSFRRLFFMCDCSPKTKRRWKKYDLPKTRQSVFFHYFLVHVVTIEHSIEKLLSHTSACMKLYWKKKNRKICCFSREEKVVVCFVELSSLALWSVLANFKDIFDLNRTQLITIMIF